MIEEDFYMLTTGELLDISLHERDINDPHIIVKLSIKSSKVDDMKCNILHFSSCWLDDVIRSLLDIRMHLLRYQNDPDQSPYESENKFGEVRGKINKLI